MNRTVYAVLAAASVWLVPSLSRDGGAALAQSNPCFNPGAVCRALQTGDVPTASQWNSFFTAKQDALASGSVIASWLAAGAAASNLGTGGVTASLLASGAAASNLGFTPLNPASNLSDLSNAATARGNLGLNALATVSPGTGVAAALGVNTGSAGAVVINGGPLGTPSTATLTNATGLPITTGVSGLGSGIPSLLSAAQASWGAIFAAANNVVADALFAQDGVINGTDLSSAALVSAGHSCNVANAPTGDVGKIVSYVIGGPGSALSSPSAPTLGQTSGGNGSTTGTFYVKTWYDAPQVTGAPGTTLPSSKSSLAVTTNNILTVTSPPMVQGARGWHVGVASSTGAEVQQDDATTYIPIGATWQMPLAGLINQGAVPVSNNTAQGFVLQTTVAGCNGTHYTLASGVTPALATANSSWTTASTTISLASCPSPTPSVGASVWDATGLLHPYVVGTFASCSGGTLTLQTNPYTGSSKPAIPSKVGSNNDQLVFGGTGFFAIGTDNSPALNTLIASNSRARIFLPCGNVLINTTVLLDRISLEGCNQGGDLLSFTGSTFVPSQTGTVIFATNLTQPLFTMFRSPALKGLGIFYPGQMGTQPAPQVFAPTIADDGSDAISSMALDNVTFYNPFNLFTISNWNSKLARAYWHNVTAFVIDTGINLPAISETLFISNSDINCNVFHDVCPSGATYLQGYGNTYANFEVFPGNGDGTNCAPGSMGQQIANTTWHNVNHIFHVAGGLWNESVVEGADAGSINAALYVSPLGSISNNVQFLGGIYQNTGGNGEPILDLKGTCTTSTNGTVTSAGVGWIAAAGGISVTGGNLNHLTVTGGKINAGNTAGLGSPEYALYLNDVNLNATVNGVTMLQAHTGANYDGIYPVNVKQFSVTGNNLLSEYYALDLGGWVSGPGVFDGNTVLSSAATYSVNMNAAATAFKVTPHNSLDKPPVSGYSNSTKTQAFGALGKVTAATPVCQVQGCTPTGSSYGNALTGTITLTTNGGKFVCSTYPVLNVTTNAGGNIPTVNSVVTQGSCTVMGGTADEVWSVTSGLPAGSGALFALTWTPITQTYTPSPGMQYAMVYANGAGSQGGGGANVNSGTASSGGGGGGGGAQTQCLLSAAVIGASQTVTVGLGGRNGGNPGTTASSVGTIGQDGGATSLGSLCQGNPGGAGFGGINAATNAGGGAGGGVAVAGNDGASGAGGATAQGGGAGGAGVGGSPGTFLGAGGGGAGANSSGSANAGGLGVGGGGGGGSGGGLTTGPATATGGNGGKSNGTGTGNSTTASGGTANNSGAAGGSPTNAVASSPCAGGGAGGGSGLTTTVAGNGGAGGLCSGGGGAGSVVAGTGSAPGFGGPGGDGALTVVEHF